MYQKGDKFKINMEGEEKYFKYVDEVVDHIENIAHFEVDSFLLRSELIYTNKHDKLRLSEDCTIERIA